jgi:branched-chain amino acid transport system permease protein
MEITPSLIALQLVTGIALGAVYALLALGLSLIFGMLTVVNFAHGAFFMVGAFVGLYFLGLTGNFWFSLVLTPLVVGAIGLVTERFLVRPLYGRGIDYPLLLTFGLSWVLIEAMRVLFGIEGLPSSTPAVLRGSVDLGFGFFPKYRLFLIFATAVVVLALWLFLEKTRYGLIVRAGSRDGEICKVLGVDIARVWLLVFGIGTAIAGLSGVLAAPTRAVNPEMGIHVLAESFVVTVVGGMGSLVGAVVAGLLVGVVFSMTSLFAPELAELSIFVLMAVVLLIRPQGFFGKAGLMSKRPAAASPCNARPGRASSAASLGKAPRDGKACRSHSPAPRGGGGLVPAGLPAADALPRAGDQHPGLRPVRGGLQPAVRLHRAAELRTRGLPGRGQLPAPALPWCTAAGPGGRRWAWAWLAAALVGVVMGFLAIRSRGIYFSMVTLALAQIVYYAFYKAERWTGGENGLRGIQVPAIELRPWRLDFLNPVTKYYVILIFVAAALWFVSRLLASPFGAVIEACARTTAAPPPAATTWRAPSCWCSCSRPRSAGWPGRCARCTCRSCRSTRCTTCCRARR